MKTWILLGMLSIATFPAYGQSAAEVERARLELNALGQKLEATDPYYQQRFPLLLQHIDRIKLNYPASEWASQAERIYWALPSPADFARAAGPIPLTLPVGAPAPCERMESLRQDFEHSAVELLQCTQSRDFRNDCTGPLSAVQTSAEQYEEAVSDPDLVCGR